MKKHLLVHLRKEEIAEFETALNYLRNFISAVGAENAECVLVVNGPAVRFFRKTSDFAAKVRNVVGPAVKIKLCHHALEHCAIEEDMVLPECGIVPYGIMELVSLQDQGFRYVKA